MVRSLDEADRQTIAAIGDDELNAAAIVIACLILLVAVLAALTVYAELGAH